MKFNNKNRGKDWGKMVKDAFNGSCIPTKERKEIFFKALQKNKHNPLFN